MKKINVIFGCALFVLLFTGCSKSNNANLESSPDNIIQAEQTENETVVSGPEQAEVGTNDLLYKEYQSGEKFFEGIATIAKTDILRIVNEPEKVVVLYNDEVQEIIDFKNDDIKVEIPNEGNYCFLVMGKNEEVVDITNVVKGETIAPEGTGVIPLK